MATLELPISRHLPAISECVRQHGVTLLEASPGSGKTTLVPLHLLSVFTGKILVLEPRRMATRWAAQHVAKLHGTPLGETVGYMYRFENKTTKDTRLIFLTEGTFLQYLKANPKLSGVDAVILDEFHERHLTTDMALGLLTHKQDRPKVLIMSATLDTQILTRHFPDLGTHSVSVPVYPLTLEYAPSEVEWHKRDLTKKVLWGIQRALSLEGDILVFLPGLSEIRQLQTVLTERLSSTDMLLLTMHGQESSPDHLLLKPQPERRLILASNIAESSLTIPGVRVVVDAGLQREAVYSAWSGRTDLVTLLCSQASAIQRAGRAARTAPGVCIRLYTEADFLQRPRFTTPEIAKTDLAAVCLELAYWNVSPEEFPWPEAPPAALVAEALQLLEKLEALKDGKLTRIGDLMQSVPLPVRYARVWAEAFEQGTHEAFHETCVQLAHFAEPGAAAKQLATRLQRSRSKSGSQDVFEKFFMTGFFDHIAKGRSQDVVTVAGETLPLSFEVKKIWDPKRAFWLVMEKNPLNQSVTQLLPLEEEWVMARATKSVEHVPNEAHTKMLRRETWKLGALTLKTVDTASTEALAPGGLAIKARGWLEQFKASEHFLRWQIFQRELFPEKSLLDFEWELFLEEFLLDPRPPTPEVEREFLSRLRDELQLYFDPSFTDRLDARLPTHLELHPKRRCEIHYERDQSPWIEAYIQDFFGTKATPALLNGALPLTLHLWGPHGRALQVTSDLTGFWQRHYPQLKKELSRDYPRHFWPEDPTTAPPMLRKPKPQG